MNQSCQDSWLPVRLLTDYLQNPNGVLLAWNEIRNNAVRVIHGQSVSLTQKTLQFYSLSGVLMARHYNLI